MEYKTSKLCFQNFLECTEFSFSVCLFVSVSLSLTCHLEFTMQSLKQIFCCCSVTKSCLTLCDPMDCSTPGFPVHHQLPAPTQTHVESMMPSSHLILCCPLLLQLSVLPSIRVSFSESALCIRWPKDWSFSISPSSEYSQLFSFRIDWFDLLAEELSRVFSSTTVRKQLYFVIKL